MIRRTKSLPTFFIEKHATPWYIKLFGWKRWELLVFAFRLLHDMAKKPHRIPRFLGYVLPWLEEWSRHDFDRKWLGQFDYPGSLVKRFLLAAWATASGKHMFRWTIISLPVLSNKFDAPCAGCGRCCRVPKGGSGFHSVQVFRWEKFRHYHPEIARPCPDRPGEYRFKFVPDGEGGLRCPLLSSAGRCTAYGHRPTACVVFNCADGMSEYSEHKYAAATFLQNAPEVKERLVQLGFKKVNKYETEQPFKQRQRERWLNSKEVSGLTTAAPFEALAVKRRPTVSSMS